MQKRNFLWLGLLLAAMLNMGFTGCEGDDEDPGDVETGTVELMLTGTAPSGNVYRLRDAFFEIDPAGIVLFSEDDPESGSIVQTLEVGGYILYLLDGWRLEKVEPDGTAMDVEATLVSPNPEEFEIWAGEQTNVTFVFETGEGTVVLDEGDLVIDIAVQEACVDDSDCSNGSVCIDGYCVQGGEEEICDDGMDNDGDDLIDCEDGDCMYDPFCEDIDGDGFPAPEDCNDWDPMINPAMPEECDGLDNDCDGQVDEGCEEIETICDDDFDNDYDGLVDCDDDDCVGNPACGGNVGDPCASDADCLDSGDPCMMASCDPAALVCVLDPGPDGMPCDDGDLCTIDDMCMGGVCVGPEIMVCDDDNICTQDMCEPTLGCVSVPEDGLTCDDGDLCTTNDMCVDAMCVGLDPLDCDDGDECTIDMCEPDVGCIYSLDPDC